MRYLITIAMLLVLCSCENNSPVSPDTGKVEVTPERAAGAKTPDDPDKPLKGHVGRAGMYRMVRSGGVINDPSTSTGKSVAKPVVELVRTTDRIPLIKGVQMYLQYRIWPLPAQPAYADLRRVLKHPAMTLPDGTVSTGSDYMVKAKVDSKQAIGYTGYGFDEDYELIEGDWIFEVWYQDKKIIEQKFTTYRPDADEVAKLSPILALGNRAVGQSVPTGKPFSKFDFPKITIGGTKSPASKGSVSEPSVNTD